MRRSTPCVDGWCGPKLTVSISPPKAPVAVSRVMVTPWAMVSVIASRLGWRRLPRLVLFRELHHLAADRIVPPQRVADPVVGHQDAGQVGVADELDAEHVERLALVPVGGRKKVADGIDARRIAVDEGPHTDLLPGVEVAQLVDDLEARRPLRPRAVGEVVDGGEKKEQAVTVVAQTRQRRVDVVARDGDPRVARADATFDHERIRDHWRGVIPWALIRSCRIISALSRSSGRGGQPGT